MVFAELGLLFYGPFGSSSMYFGRVNDKPSFSIVVSQVVETQNIDISNILCNQQMLEQCPIVVLHLCRSCEPRIHHVPSVHWVSHYKRQ